MAPPAEPRQQNISTSVTALGYAVLSAQLSASPGKDVFISPLSIYGALTLALNAAGAPAEDWHLLIVSDVLACKDLAITGPQMPCTHTHTRGCTWLLLTFLEPAPASGIRADAAWPINARISLTHHPRQPPCSTPTAFLLVPGIFSRLLALQADLLFELCSDRAICAQRHFPCLCPLQHMHPSLC